MRWTQAENSWSEWTFISKIKSYNHNKKNHHQDDNSSWKFISRVTIIKISIKWGSISKLKSHNPDEMSSSRWNRTIKTKFPNLGAESLLRWKPTIKLNNHWMMMNDYHQHKIWWWKFIIMIKIHHWNNYPWFRWKFMI